MKIKGKQKIDNYARTYLYRISTGFEAYLGQKKDSQEGVEFIAPPGILSRVWLENKRNKFLFGGLFSLQLFGEVEKRGLKFDKSPIRLNYKGVVSKGEAFFNHPDYAYQELVCNLNKDKSLVALLSKLDIEKLEINMEEDKYTIKLIPLSGTFMYMVFPPLQYSGQINKNEIRDICSAVDRISNVLAECKAS